MVWHPVHAMFCLHYRTVARLPAQRSGLDLRIGFAYLQNSSKVLLGPQALAFPATSAIKSRLVAESEQLVYSNPPRAFTFMLACCLPHRQLQCKREARSSSGPLCCACADPTNCTTVRVIFPGALNTGKSIAESLGPLLFGLLFEVQIKLSFAQHIGSNPEMFNSSLEPERRHLSTRTM